MELRRHWFRKAAVATALVGFGLCLGLVGLEVILRLAGPFLRPPLRGFDDAAKQVRPGTLRVLCVGDSHTYGLWVHPEQSYPSRLRAEMSHSAEEVVVLNAGVPGMNSSQLRQAIPSLVESFAPDVVLVMIGVADGWNLAALNAEDFHGWRWYLHGGGLWDRSRVVKLARLIYFNLTYKSRRTRADVAVVPESPSNWNDWKIQTGGHEIAVSHNAHFSDPLSDRQILRRVLRRDLAVITSAVQARGAKVVLMTYASDGFIYGDTNAVIREFAQEMGVPLIDLGMRLRWWSAPPGRALAFFPDMHPRAVGYKLIARVVAGTLLGMAGPVPTPRLPPQ
jgi:hypothetical protein